MQEKVVFRGGAVGEGGEVGGEARSEHLVRQDLGSRRRGLAMRSRPTSDTILSTLPPLLYVKSPNFLSISSLFIIL